MRIIGEENFKGCQLYIGETPVVMSKSSKLELAEPEPEDKKEPTNWGGSYSWSMTGDLLINKKTMHKLFGVPKPNKKTRRERHIYNVWRRELKRVKLRLPLYSEWEHKRRITLLYHVINYINSN